MGGTALNFLTVMNQVIVIFIIVMVGFILRKINYLNKQIIKGITDILLNVAIPAITIYSFNMELTEDTLAGASIVLIFGLLSMGSAAVIGAILFRKYPPDIKTVMRFAAVFTNSAFMGFPVLGSIFGGLGIFYASMYGIAFNLYLWTFGRILFTGSKDLTAIKKALLNPGIISVIIGLIFFLTPLEMPFLMVRTSEMLGNLTTPLAMIVIGARLADVKPREMLQGKQIYYAAVLRLLVFPAVALLILKALNVEQQVLAVCTLLTAMPAASNTVLFAENYGGDSLLASKIVALSTALSILTIPLFAMLLT